MENHSSFVVLTLLRSLTIISLGDINGCFAEVRSSEVIVEFTFGVRKQHLPAEGGALMTMG